VVIAWATIQFYFSVTFLNGFTAYFNPIINEFGWSYLVVSLASTFRGFQSGFMAPFVGYIVERFHPQRTLLASSILGAAGFFLLSQIHSLVTFYISFMVLGLCVTLSSSVVVNTATTKWFKKRTSLALGILTAGAGMSGILVPFVIWLVDIMGWRSVMEWFAAGSLVICLPLCFIVKEPPKENYNSSKQAASLELPEKSIPTKQIILNRNFWVLSLVILFSGAAYSAVSVHQIPYLVSTGMNRDVVGWMVVIYSLAGVLGRVFFGWLGDFVDGRYCFVLISIMQAAGLILFAYSISWVQFFFKHNVDGYWNRRDNADEGNP